MSVLSIHKRLHKTQTTSFRVRSQLVCAAYAGLEVQPHPEQLQKCTGPLSEPQLLQLENVRSGALDSDLHPIGLLHSAGRHNLSQVVRGWIAQVRQREMGHLCL